MAALYAVGGTLPNGNTVVSDVLANLGNGTTQETITDSGGNTFSIIENPANSALANQEVITTRVEANLTTLETWITANPNGAVLTAAQTLVLAKMISALTRLTLDQFTTVGGA
jgi:hypothetical protein